MNQTSKRPSIHFLLLKTMCSLENKFCCQRNDLLSLNTRYIVYSFMTMHDLINLVSRVSKRDRQILSTRDEELLERRGPLIIAQKLACYVFSGTPKYDNFECQLKLLLGMTNGVSIEVHDQSMAIIKLFQHLLLVEKTARDLNKQVQFLGDNDRFDPRFNIAAGDTKVL